jgi:hypothetical protein
VPDTVTGAIEAAVGAACLAIAWVALRRAGMRWFGFIVALAGLGALGHAGWSLMRG